MTPKRIAIVGGSNFDSTALDRFLWQLREKYPNVTIVTGDGRGAERHAADSATVLGFPVERPPLRPEWYGKEAMMVQVGMVIGGDIELYRDPSGKIQHRCVGHGRADILLIVGEGARVKRAFDILHTVNMHERDQRGSVVKRNGEYVSHRVHSDPLVWHHIAVAKSAKPKAKKAARKSKKTVSLAL